MKECAVLRRVQVVLAAFIIIQTAISCGEKRESYTIGVSQCSEDLWRQKLKEELEIATYFNENVSLLFTCANDDSALQENQIDSLIAAGVDLLIVSPNQVDLLSASIDKAYDAGIPVILFDRKTNSSKYTAFMGTDNFHIGEMLGHYLAAALGRKGNILEIKGLVNSSPANERHDGFVSAICAYPEMKIVGSINGDWTEQSGYDATATFLKTYAGRVDAVFGGNDRMAKGARMAMKDAGRDRKEIVYVGIDALPTEDGGMRLVSDSILTASAIYPTHGDELMLLALDILEGRDYTKEKIMTSSIVTADNADILLLQHEEVFRQADYLKTMHLQAGRMHDSMKLQQVIIGLMLLLATTIAILLSIYVRAYRQKHELNSQLQEKMEKVERQRDELEEQRDKLIELSLRANPEEESGQSSKDSDFISRFNQVVQERLSDPEVSVEDISSELCVSRVQLYRRVKSITGKSPVEIIRQLRLAKADKMLAETSLNISEIAYKVGFSSASYFTKCYRDCYDRLPTDVKRP